MKSFFHYALWVSLAGLFGIALVSLIPPTISLALNTVKGDSTHNLTYQVVAAGGVVNSPVAPKNILDPVFTPPAAGKAIRADLSAMKISLYDDGKEVGTFNILAKGKPGTAWETPAGDYHVLTKEENHFSTIGQVWMPWSLQFFGNFFIHGWPYDERGKAVPEGYSGGCIRLSTADAETVYNFATKDTMVSVYGAALTTPALNQAYYLTTNDQPKVTAASYAVADLETGDLIMAKDDETARPIASVSKLLTALTSLDVINQYQVATVGPAAVAAYGTQGNLKAGEKLPINELLFPLLLESSNDAAEVLATHFGRASFINQVNTKAAAIGLTKTHFEDPSGLSPQNVSTARDLARLAKHIYQYKRYIFDVTSQSRHTYNGQTWINSNKLVGTTGYLGGKNGFTDEAEQTQVALFNLPLSEFTQRPVVVVLLKSTDRDKDMSALVNFVKKHAVFGEEPKNPTFHYL